MFAVLGRPFPKDEFPDKFCGHLRLIGIERPARQFTEPFLSRSAGFKFHWRYFYVIGPVIFTFDYSPCCSCSCGRRRGFDGFGVQDECDAVRHYTQSTGISKTVNKTRQKYMENYEAIPHCWYKTCFPSATKSAPPSSASRSVDRSLPSPGSGHPHHPRLNPKRCPRSSS